MQLVLHFATECDCEGAPGAPGHIDVLPLTAQHPAALGEEVAPVSSLLSSAFRQGLSLMSVPGLRLSCGSLFQACLIGGCWKNPEVRQEPSSVSLGLGLVAEF